MINVVPCIGEKAVFSRQTRGLINYVVKNNFVVNISMQMKEVERDKIFK